MKKVGFIDYYLDEWHANNYPQIIAERSEGRYGVACAYGKTDSPIGGMTNAEWSEKMGIPLVNTIEEVIEQSDVLIVLSPDNPEMHKELTELPLASGKLTYVDKTFAPDKETAEEIFAHADFHGTKCFSSSALRFASEIQDIDTDKIYKIYSEGPGFYDIYSIHQVEPIISLMKTRAKRVMALGDKAHPSLVIEFEDGRTAEMNQRLRAKFRLAVVDDENFTVDYLITSDHFSLFIDAMIKFFDSGEIPVPHEQTVDVIAVCHAGQKAFEAPYQWIEV